jgi:hypothetical protein
MIGAQASLLARAFEVCEDRRENTRLKFNFRVIEAFVRFPGYRPERTASKMLALQSKSLDFFFDDCNHKLSV